MEKLLVYAYIKDKEGNEKIRQLIGYITFEGAYMSNKYSLSVDNALMSNAVKEHKQLNNITPWIEK